jgi:hypothetical protein
MVNNHVTAEFKKTVSQARTLNKIFITIYFSPPLDDTIAGESV